MINSGDKEQLDVDRNIIALIVFAIICGLLLILIVNLSINTSNGIRAYVAGEGFWAKAQKESIIHLNHYIFSEEEEHYEAFSDVLRINFGDQQAREEMLKDSFDYDIAYEGLIAGRNHPSDIPHMIRVMRWFHEVPHVKKAITAWQQADLKIAELVSFAELIHSEIQKGEVSTAQKKQWLERLDVFDHELTVYEVRFAQAMGDMARLVNTILRWSTIILGFTLLGIGIWLIIRFFNSTKAWMKALKSSEEKFKHVLANSRDVLYKMDLRTKKYVYASPALTNMLGYDIDEFMEGGVDFILNRMHPDDKSRLNEVVKKYESHYDEDFLPLIEFRIKDNSGNWIWVSNARTLVRNEQGDPEAIVGTVRDIAQQKAQEDKIKKSLHEKEILLQEIHHRVKNNLAIISSLLELQKDGVSEDVSNMLSSSQSRIKSIAKVHEKLYESTTLSDIPLEKYISELAEEIGKAYHSSQKDITLEIDVLPLTVNINEAIPIGLVLNEIINNAFKHGFKGLEEGVLRISVKEEQDEMVLIIENNGHKMNEDIQANSGNSLGMTLIEVLAKRINGRLVIENDEWTRFKIFFTLKDH